MNNLIAKNEEFEEAVLLKDYSKNITSCNKFEYMPKIFTIKFWHEFEDDASLYNSYFEVLQKAREEDTIIFYFNSGGGSVHTLFLFLDALRNCKSKNIIAKVNFAASAAALMALFCDNIEFTMGSTLMLHNFSILLHGKSQELESSFVHFKKQFHDVMRLICKRVLSNEEIEQMINGKDFYFSGEEVVSRLKKYAAQKIKEQKSKKSK